MLAHHPDISMPPMKEIGYWWGMEFLPEATYLTRFTGDHWFFRTRRGQILQSLEAGVAGFLKRPSARAELAWSLRYALLPHNDDWYDGLFDASRVSGDITPKYCELPEERVAALSERYPAARIVISLRDPVEREWSRAKMNLCAKRNRKPEDVPDAEWIEHFDRPAQADANDYVGVIERWTRHFGAERVHTFFLDEVLEDSWAVFGELCRFLGVSPPPEKLRSEVEQPKNVGRKEGIPPELAGYLFRKHRARIEALAAARPATPFPRRWLAKYTELVEEPEASRP